MTLDALFSQTPRTGRNARPLQRAFVLANRENRSSDEVQLTRLRLPL